MTTSEPSVTAVLAENASRLSFSHIPDEAVLAAKQCLLDVVGVALAGAATPAARIAAGAALEDAPSGPCAIIGTESTTSPSGAALANGTAMHALDYDDMSVPLCGHPTAPIAPALLALCEANHLGGRDLLTAFIAGYEAECRVGASVDPGHYARGFHATATVGTIGAAVAAARLFGLGAAQMEMAIGIGVTQSGGLKSMFGTMCKPLHAGRAAASGILAARLARDGFTSAEDAIACAQGFAEAESGTFAPEYLLTPFGEPWHVLGNLFKFHAACYFTHGAIEAMLDLHRAAISPESLTRVDIHVPSQHLSVCNIVGPSSGLEGKFSFRYAAAVALTAGVADESCFTDELVRRDDLVGLQQRIDVVTDDALGTYDTVVEAWRGNERQRIEKNTSTPRWESHPKEQSEALVAKFRSLADPLLGPGRAKEIVDTVLRLDEIDDIGRFTGLLTPSLVRA